MPKKSSSTKVKKEEKKIKKQIKETVKKPPLKKVSSKKKPVNEKKKITKTKPLKKESKKSMLKKLSPPKKILKEEKKKIPKTKPVKKTIKKEKKVKEFEVKKEIKLPKKIEEPKEHKKNRSEINEILNNRFLPSSVIDEIIIQVSKDKKLELTTAAADYRHYLKIKKCIDVENFIASIIDPITDEKKGISAGRLLNRKLNEIIDNVNEWVGPKISDWKISDQFLRLEAPPTTS